MEDGSAVAARTAVVAKRRIDVLNAVAIFTERIPQQTNEENRVRKQYAEQVRLTYLNPKKSMMGSCEKVFAPTIASSIDPEAADITISMSRSSI